MVDVSREAPARWMRVRLFAVLDRAARVRRREAFADTPAGRLLLRLEEYRTDRRIPGPGVECGYRVGSVMFRLRSRVGDSGAVVVQGLNSGRPRSGEGSHALRVLCAAADACGAALVLDARPYATEAVVEPMTRDVLVAWYGRFGFEPTGPAGMRRLPAHAAEPSAAE